MIRRELDVLLALLTAGDAAAAITGLASLEWQAFERRDRAAGELAFARKRAEHGDVGGAAEVVARLREGCR